MKNFLKSTLLITLSSLVFASCMDKGDNIDYEAEYKKQEQQIDSLLSAQKIKIEEYKNEFFTNAIEDTVKMSLPRINKKVNRGIWYEVISEPTDNSYTYSLNSTGNAIVFPKLKLKYTAKLLNNTVVESDLVGTDYNLGISSSKITQIWLYSFFPYSIKFNADNIFLYGLTEFGLKKGSKFKVITPSYFAYGNNAQTSSQGTIPANSPLVYEFEVLEINN